MYIGNMQLKKLQEMRKMEVCKKYEKDGKDKKPEEKKSV